VRLPDYDIVEQEQQCASLTTKLLVRRCAHPLYWWDDDKDRLLGSHGRGSLREQYISVSRTLPIRIQQWRVCTVGTEP
jgi:hypothetical protein